MRAPPAVLAAALALACAPAGDREVRLARLESERRRLGAALDELEARLHATRARVRLWEDVRERQEGVPAITRHPATWHAEETAGHELPRGSLHRARVASVAPDRPARGPTARRGD